MTVDSSNTLSRHLRCAVGLPDPGSPDTQLLDRFASVNDEAAFAELVRRYGSMVLGVCRRIVGNTHDADDAFQATFLVLARKARSVAGLPSLGAWLYGVAHRSALKARRAAARRRARESAAARPEGVEAMPEHADTLAVIEQELARLPKKYREALVLCALCGRPRKEVATQLGVAEGTLASRIAKAREMLAERLSRRGVAVPAAVVAVAAHESSTTSAALPASLTDTTTKIATGTVPAAVEQIASEVLKSMFLSKLRTTAFLLVAAAIACAAGVMAFAHNAPNSPAPMGEAPQKPVAEKLENGVYQLKFEGDGKKVKLTDGSEAVLGKRLSNSIGTGVSVESWTNDNTRFYFHAKELGPLPKDTEGQTALVVNGVVLHISLPEKLAVDQTVSIGANVYTPEAATTLSAAYQISAKFRKHPGHRYEVRWTPDKREYQVGAAVVLKMEIKNTGTGPLRFTHGGKQRGPRDNQFRFIAQEGFEGKGLPDTGHPTNFGGKSQGIELKPGESYTTEVDLSKWFTFTKANVYRITGVFEMPIFDPSVRPAGGEVLWDDLAVGECSIRVVKK